MAEEATIKPDDAQTAVAVLEAQLRAIGTGGDQRRFAACFEGADSF
jgi:hypothetical protein